MADEAVDLLRNFVVALQRNDRRGSNDFARRLLLLGSPLRQKWKLVAQVMQTNGELTAANSAMALYVAQTGASAQARFEQAAVAAQTGRIEDALRIMNDIPSDVPDRAGHAFLLGTILNNLGSNEEAERHLLAALDAQGDLGQAMLALAALRRRDRDDPVAARILASDRAMAGAPVLERAQYHYAVGRILGDLGEIDPAFAHISKGAVLAGGQRPYDAGADSADARRSMAGYDPQMIRHIGATVTTDTSPAIFVTGLPRSGTTLVEQILVSHSVVEGGEELGRMGIVQRELSENSGKGLAEYLRRGNAEDLAALYLHLCRERFGGGQRFVDKGLNSTRHIGLIAALLPDAPIVWLRRDPLDCAWSAFRTYFVKGLDWSWRLEDIAAHFRLEDELFSYWSRMLPERILVVDYSKLVTEPHAQIERILSHCGLPVEAQVFEPHKTKRVVATASVMQVREPINRKGLGNSDLYREHLRPFSDAYGPA